jgi:thioredoxin 1
MNKVTLVDFYADWCSACKAQDPILSELERDMGHKVDIIKISLADNKDMFDEFKIDATPTLFVIKNNNVFKKYVGVTSRNELESAINSASMLN